MTLTKSKKYLSSIKISQIMLSFKWNSFFVVFLKFGSFSIFVISSHLPFCRPWKFFLEYLRRQISLNYNITCWRVEKISPECLEPCLPARDMVSWSADESLPHFQKSIWGCQSYFHASTIVRDSPQSDWSPFSHLFTPLRTCAYLVDSFQND